MREVYKKLAFYLAIAPALLVFICGASHGAGPAAIDPADYPIIGDTEMGQLRWALKIAEQPVDDFTLIGADDQAGGGGYRYTIAFMTYFLALEQYHKLPACPEIIQPAMDRLIKKMIAKPTWQYWAQVSQGVPRLEPLMNRPYPESHDPIIDQNIMYSGHLGHMIGLYETLYRNFKWSEKDSIVFAWSGDEKYVYDNHSLQKIMYDQMNDNPWHSIACEPNAVFPACNQHPVMSFILYDHAHGADLAEVNDLFMESFIEKRLIDPWTHHAAAYYMVKQDLTLSGGHVGISASMDGWTAAFMHVWQPDYIDRHYPYMRRDQVIWKDAERARLRLDYGPGQSLKYGYFAMLAKEVGDVETADKLIRQAEKTYRPKWEDGLHYYYPDQSPYAKIRSLALTGKLIALARANSENGLGAMHNQPFDNAHFSEPRLSGVDFPNLLLKRAVHDRAGKALVITTAPGNSNKQKSSFTVERLNPQSTYVLHIDGEERERFTGKSSIEIEVGLDGAHDLVLTEM